MQAFQLKATACTVSFHITSLPAANDIALGNLPTMTCSYCSSLGAFCSFEPLLHCKIGRPPFVMWWWGPHKDGDIEVHLLLVVVFFFFSAGFAGIVLLHEVDRLPQGSAVQGLSRKRQKEWEAASFPEQLRQEC